VGTLIHVVIMVLGDDAK